MSYISRNRDPEVMRIPFEGDERARFRRYVQANSKNKGQFIRSLILRAMEAETPRGVAALLPEHPGAAS